MSDIYVRLRSNISSMISTSNKFTATWKKLGKVVRDSNSGFVKAQKEISKVNKGFTNITRDGNRATGSVNRLGKSFMGLGTAIKMVGFYQIVRGLTGAIDSAMEMIETANLFSVALGDLAVETNGFVQEWSRVTGLDATNMQNAIGTFGALSKSMGMSDKASQQLSTTTYRLGLDLASLYNVNIDQALGDLRSGLVGQSETVYKYGLDVTEASLKTEAMNQGITKSVRNMSQGEKMALRYAVMIRQSGVAQGDFARTIEQPANQLRIFTERMTTLSRTIGTIFIPILQKVLPYVNAFTQALTVLFARLASFFGYTDSMAEIFNFDRSGVDGVGAGVEDLEDGIGSAGKEAKKLKGQLMGFDEINLWTPPTENASSGGAGGAGAIAGGVDMSWMDDLTYDSGFDQIKTKSQELADGMVAQWDRMMDATYRLRYALKDLWDEGLSLLGDFSFGVLSDFYNNFLVPVGKWVFGEGLPKLVNIFNDMLKKINWGAIRDSLNNVWKALAPFMATIGTGMLIFLEKVLVPLAVWAINNIIPFAFDLIADAITFFTEVGKTSQGVIMGLWQNVLIPLGEFLLTRMQEAWNKTIEVLKWLNENIIVPLIDILRILWQNVLAPLAVFLSDILVGAFGFVIDVAKSLWENVLVPLGSFIVEVFAEALKGLRDVLVELEPTINFISDAFMFLWNYVLAPLASYIAGDFFTIVNTTFEHLGTAIEALKEVFKGLINFIVGVLTGDWKRAFTGLGNIAIAIFNGIIGGFENTFNWIVDKINNLANKANAILAGLGANFRFDTLSRFELERLDYLDYGSSSSKPMLQYATGGFPRTGQVFIAGEAGAEMVGSLDGKPAVVNNDQIVEAVSSGVYGAVVSAMNMSNTGGSGQPSEVTLEIDGTKLGRILLPKMNGESERLGYKPILEAR